MIGGWAGRRGGQVERAPAQKAADLDRSLDAFGRIVGRRPTGYRAPVCQASEHAVDLLLARGFAYESSMMADDVSYLLRTARGDLVEIARHVLAERGRGADIRVEQFPYYTERQQ
jgi:peptidoglycan/xylan/chitin deacetylase (PgdA/CDA1 family)